MSMTYEPRGQWPRLWLAAPRAALLAAGERLRSLGEIRHLALPQNGLALLPLVDGAFHESFNLGEIPLASTQLSIHSQDGRVARGASCVMQDDMALVETLALADAVLGAGWPEGEALATLLSQGRAALDETTLQRKAMLAATTVDFALLGEAEDDDNAA
ncbi:MAG: phosphonate C-P lyase system protein PhnG [Halothiobacillaceae bacterium]|nr:phosphonate C-P lyase system protein PhnG [Halothiobacillaceae bacterium]